MYRFGACCRGLEQTTWPQLALGLLRFGLRRSPFGFRSARRLTCGLRAVFLLLPFRARGLEFILSLAHRLGSNPLLLFELLLRLRCKIRRLERTLDGAGALLGACLSHLQHAQRLAVASHFYALGHRLAACLLRLPGSGASGLGFRLGDGTQRCIAARRPFFGVQRDQRHAGLRDRRCLQGSRVFDGNRRYIVRHNHDAHAELRHPEQALDRSSPESRRLRGLTSIGNDRKRNVRICIAGSIGRSVTPLGLTSNHHSRSQ